MRRDFDEPRRVDLDDVSHELLLGEHELEVQHPPRHLLVQTRARVHVHLLAVLDGLVGAALLELGDVVEEAGGDRLADALVVLALRLQLHLHPRQHALQLLADVAAALERADLDEILKAPVGAVVSVAPLVVDVEQRQMVAALLPEILVRCVGVDGLV